MIISVPGFYYAQQGADPFAVHPGQSFEGWGKTEIPMDTSRTAVIVMHLWQLPPYEECPAVYGHVEYLARAEKIAKEKLLPFVQTMREKGIRIIHVAAGFEGTLKTFPGYLRMAEKYPPQNWERIEGSRLHKQLQQTHWRLMGAKTEEQNAQMDAVYAKYDFAIKPLEHEDMVTHTNQLFSLCKEHGIEHLIYTGFAVNACLTMSPCGFLDMTRHGIMCSIVGDLTTAVENRESCTEQRNREYGLWQFAVQSGFVFLSEDLIQKL
ncbi:MAG: hypothetical protein J6J43_04655 [Oscillospiraceae bacterium]|nr:hypothetical protein [Oscillospiraceae bacterium]